MVKMFTTATCGACRLMKNYLKDMNVNLEEIMLSDETREAFKENQVTSAPTLLFLNEDGSLKERKEGFMPQNMFLEIYNK